MLVLSRRLGEAILIGDEIRIELIETRGGTVRLGITAVRSVSVDREEVRRRKLDSERNSAGRSDTAVCPGGTPG